MLKAFICLLFALLLIGCGKPETLQGPAGVIGATGATGAAGLNGVGCTVQPVAVGAVAPNGGAIVTCGAAQTLILNGVSGSNGTNGVNGTNGTNGLNGTNAQPSAYSIVGLIDPCGQQTQFDEVFLRMSSGALIASFSKDTGGTMTRLWEVRDGVNLMTTDDTNCVFSVSTSGGIRTISWTGGSQSWPTN